MPRKSKVTNVPINEPEGLIRAQTTEEELITDAEHMTEIAKVLDVEPTDVVETEVLPVEDVQEPIAIQEDEPTVKPKAKRAPRVKKEAVVDPVIEEQTTTINEIVAKVELPKEKSTTENNKVECPDCGKTMSAKTLRYSHGPYCLFKKTSRQRRSTNDGNTRRSY